MNNNVKTALIIGGVIVAVLVVLPLIFGAVGGWQGGVWGMMGPGMMGGFGVMGLGMVVFWGLIIWLVVALARGSTGPVSYDSGHADSALEVLRKRYARGEISKEEYEEKKKDLA